MRVLSVIHHLDAAAGVFEEPALAAGHELVEWLPHESAPPSIDGFDAAMIFGGEAQVDEEDAYPWLRSEKDLVAELLEREIPLLGVCLGSQLVAGAAGAVVRRAAAPEIGWHEIALTPHGVDDPVLGFLPWCFDSFGWHYYEWLLPPGGVELARSAACLQAFRLESKPAWGVQFHPEVTLADLESWVDRWEADLAADGLDPDAILAESAAKIESWNGVGREISERFLAVAAGALAG